LQVPRSKKRDTNFIAVSDRNARAADSLQKRAERDLLVLDLTKTYEASLQVAAKKCLEALRHIDSVVTGQRFPQKELSMVKKMLTSSIRLIVQAGTSKKG